MEPTPPITPPISAAKSPLSLNLILSLIAITSLLLTGYFIYQNRLLQQRLATIESSQLPSPVEPTPPPAGESVDETTNWKTYTDNSLEFELRHPVEMEFVATNPPKTSISGRMKESYYTSQSQYIEFNIDVSSETPESVLKKEGYGEMKTIEIFGQKVNSYFGFGGDGGSYPFKMFAVTHNNRTYFFNISTFNKWDTVDKILSTFKFTDENSVEGSFCGGIAGIPCPSGYKCLLDGNYPDAGGTCQK